MLQQSIPLPHPLIRPAETILVNVFPQETRVAILENNTIVEIHIERSRKQSFVGNIYLGVVQRVLPGMQSAFIDIGLEKAAFLHVADLVERCINPNDNCPIEQILFEGQVIPVQVTKDPFGNKGARLSTQISLAGRFLVHLPQDSHIGISQRIENEEERLRLKEMLESLIPEGEPSGYILRTSAEHASSDALKMDIDYLCSVREEIYAKAKTQAGKTLLFHEQPLHIRLLRDYVIPSTQTILVDNKEAFHQMREFASKYVQHVKDNIQLFEHKEKTLFEYYDVDNEIKRSLYPRVNLHAGGYLIIEPTEAMTTIDVNTGGFIGLRDFSHTILKTNLAACKIIARELRLRNIGGMILVDFIDMDKDEHREIVLQELAKALSYDRTRITLNGFTSLGLVEITRKRTRESLYHVLTSNCPYCNGRGRTKTLQTICYEILRSIKKLSMNEEYKQFRLIAAPTVIEMLIDEEAVFLEQITESIGKRLYLTSESSYTQEYFDIIPS